MGLPHSDIRGSLPACGSPRRFAACCVFRRPYVPRHPSIALDTLTCFSFVLFGCQGASTVFRLAGFCVVVRVFCAFALFPVLRLFGRVFPDKGMMKSCFVFWRSWLCLPEIQNVQLSLLALSAFTGVCLWGLPLDVAFSFSSWPVS